MKIVKYISVICLSLLVFSACDSDLDKVYYNESEAIPAVLSGITDAYVLDANKAQTTAIEFKWTKPQAGYAAKIINSLQMDLKTRVRDNILKSKEQKNIQPTKGGHKMVTCQNYVSLFYRQITSCPSDGGIS